MSVPAAWKFLKLLAPQKIVIKLDFFTPFEGHNTAEFTMLPQGDGTHVTWVMHGPARFLTRLIQVFMNLDNMIGRDFEVGLANLKTITEKYVRHSNSSNRRSQRCRSIPICSSTAIARKR